MAESLSLLLNNFSTVQSNLNVFTFDGGDIGVGSNYNPAYKLDVNGTIHATGDVIMFSDGRYKTNIQPIENALENLSFIKGITYTWKNDPGSNKHMGVIAQEVQSVFPEAVHINQDDGKLSVAYPNLVGALIEGINTLNKQVQILTKDVQELKNNNK